MRDRNRHESARYSHLAASYMPPARANVTDQATLEIGRRMEATRATAKEQIRFAANLDKPRSAKDTESELQARESRLRELNSALDIL
jgi:chorismate-pyruvate lyase